MSPEPVKSGTNVGPTTGTTSDGYHTFDELYQHRNLLFIGLMQALSSMSWWSESHDDGTLHDGWFIAGIYLETGHITYHLPSELKPLVRGIIKQLERAPKWDGHTSLDVIDRLKVALERNAVRHCF